MTSIVLCCVVVILALITYWLGTPWLKTHVLWAWVNGDWQPLFGWGLISELWLPLLLCGVGAGVLWIPLSGWIRGRLEPLDTRFRARQVQQAVAAERQAQVALARAQAQVQALEQRLAALQHLEHREQAVSQAEARTRRLLAQTEAQAQHLLAQAQRQVQALQAQAQVTLADAQRQAADWQRRNATVHQQEQALHDQLAYVCKHATRIHSELHWATQECRAINGPLVHKEAKRLMRGLHRALPAHKRSELATAQQAAESP